MKGIATGVVSFLAVAALMIFVIYPALFGFIQGLFETSDLGTIVALGVCALVTIPALWIAIFLAVLLGALVSALTGE